MTDIDKIGDNTSPESDDGADSKGGASSKDSADSKDSASSKNETLPATPRRKGKGVRDQLGQFVIRIRPLIVFWLSVIVLGYLCYLAAQALSTS